MNRPAAIRKEGRSAETRTKSRRRYRAATAVRVLHQIDFAGIEILLTSLIVWSRDVQDSTGRRGSIPWRVENITHPGACRKTGDVVQHRQPCHNRSWRCAYCRRPSDRVEMFSH